MPRNKQNLGIMKKLITILATITCFAAVAMAQPRAIGARIGYGAEVSYQHTLGGNNFGQLDLGWSQGGFSAGFSYDFSICPLGPLNFYLGPQISLAVVSASGSSAFGMGAGAHIGLEYCFERIPLQLSLDWKPTFVFVPGTAFAWSIPAFGIRYLF